MAEAKVITEERTAKFATNFEADASGSGTVGEGGNVKVGMKTGFTNEETLKSTISYTYSLDSDNLYDHTVNFGDPVITGEAPFRIQGQRAFNISEYSNGSSVFTLEPGIKR